MYLITHKIVFVCDRYVIHKTLIRKWCNSPTIIIIIPMYINFQCSHISWLVETPDLKGYPQKFHDSKFVISYSSFVILCCLELAYNICFFGRLMMRLQKKIGFYVSFYSGWYLRIIYIENFSGFEVVANLVIWNYASSRKWWMLYSIFFV